MLNFTVCICIAFIISTFITFMTLVNIDYYCETKMTVICILIALVLIAITFTMPFILPTTRSVKRLDYTQAEKTVETVEIKAEATNSVYKIYCSDAEKSKYSFVLTPDEYKEFCMLKTATLEIAELSDVKLRIGHLSSAKKITIVSDTGFAVSEYEGEK